MSKMKIEATRYTNLLAADHDDNSGRVVLHHISGFKDGAHIGGIKDGA